MNVSLTSGASSASSLWGLLASRASASSKISDSSTSYSDSGTTSASATQRPEGPPPPPSQFDCAMSTEQFAGMGGMMGPPPGEDPIASLDADDDRSVSADEFGLDGASEEVQSLFAAMDEDGSGELSTDEIDAFREQMMAAEGGHPPEPPMGPPPGMSEASSSDDSSTASASLPDVSSFLQQLAQRYASLVSTSESDSALSVTA